MLPLLAPHLHDLLLPAARYGFLPLGAAAGARSARLPKLQRQPTIQLLLGCAFCHRGLKQRLNATPVAQRFVHCATPCRLLQATSDAARAWLKKQGFFELLRHVVRPHAPIIYVMVRRPKAPQVRAGWGAGMLRSAANVGWHAIMPCVQLLC